MTTVHMTPDSVERICDADGVPYPDGWYIWLERPAPLRSEWAGPHASEEDARDTVRVQAEIDEEWLADWIEETWCSTTPDGCSRTGRRAAPQPWARGGSPS